LIEWLINRARSFIFSTAPPPALAGAALAAVEFLNSPEGEARRQILLRNIETLRNQVPPPAPGAPPFPGTAICPWIVGDEQRALDLARMLAGRGFLVPAIRYPTVAKGSARLRITVTASHETAQIEALGQALR
jgi:7-keto-8-aminopelargonate synthetase-like enzyme